MVTVRVNDSGKSPISRKTSRRTAYRYVFIYGGLAVPMALFVVFWLLPLVDMFRMSFTNLSALNFQNPGWIGLENYLQMIHSAVFWRSVANTGEYLAIQLPIEIPLALAVALLASRIRRGRSIYLMAYFLPLVVSLTAISLLFLYFYSASGPLNALLAVFHIPPLAFLNSTTEALPSIEVINIWHTLGFSVVLFLASLQNVPTQLYEAAQMDGASGFKSFWHITLPMILPLLGVILISDVTSELQLFSPIFVMTPALNAGTPGGPLHSTINLITYLYTRSFSDYRFGYGNAVSVVLFLVNVLIMVVIFRATRAERLWQ